MDWGDYELDVPEPELGQSTSAVSLPTDWDKQIEAKMKDFDFNVDELDGLRAISLSANSKFFSFLSFVTLINFIFQNAS